MRDGRGGHPLLLSPEDVERVRGSPEDSPLRQIVDPIRFEVIDETLHLNIDTPSDIEELGLKLDSIIGEN